MHLGSALVSCFLFASAVLGLTPTEENPPWIMLSSYKAGAILTETPNTLYSVSGTFNVPEASGVNGAGAAIWIAMDGAECSQVALRGGITITVTLEGTFYNAWAQWYPTDFRPVNLTVVPGDEIDVSISTNSNGNFGTVEIKSLSQGVTHATEFVLDAEQGTLCSQDAQWIVDALWVSGDAFQPIPIFGNVVFQNAQATGVGGSYSPSNGAYTVDILGENFADPVKIWTSTVEGNTINITENIDHQGVSYHS